MSGTVAIVNGRLLGGAGATALLVERGRIALVGSDAEVRARRGPGELVDARGGLVLPGFEDAHLHLRIGARELRGARLFPLPTLEAIQAEIARHAAAHPGRPWVEGRGWLYAAFPGGTPTREQLDAVVPDRPAFMDCYDGHTGWVNSAALRIAGIDRTTPDPPNGVIVRDRDGEPTGMLKEEAQLLVERHIPPPAEAEERATIRGAVADLHRAGITAVQDAWLELEDLEFLLRLHAQDPLPVRVRGALVMAPGQTLPEWRDRLDAYERIAFPRRGDRWFDAGILKTFVDGVVESRTAAMLEPYEDDDATGLPAWEAGHLDACTAEADRRGWQVEAHAIGDRGIRMALDAFERSAAANGPWAGDPSGRGVPAGTHDRRHRIEHIEAPHPADLPRFGALGLIASMQPFHGDPSPGQISVWEAAVGARRARSAWPYRTIAATGGRLAFGSDWPVVPFDPRLGLHTATTRTTPTGEPAGGWYPDERIPLVDALVAYTHGSAYAAHADDHRGRLEPGLAADLVILDRDPLSGPASAIIDAGVRITILDGRIVHRSEGSA